VTHNKDVCQKCWRFNERRWEKSEDDEWAAGRVMCPVDHFEVMAYHGKPVKMPRGLRNMFGFIFGWHEINEPLPPWCQFQEEHSNAAK
jgi:hypothetical protein